MSFKRLCRVFPYK